MSEISANDFVAIPIPTELYQAIAQRFPDRVSTVIENVTWDFLERTTEDFVTTAKSRGDGIFWEALFLPTGTEFRVRHFGQYKYGRLEGDALNYDGKVYPSISKMANAMRGNTNVNAWKYVEVKRPTDAAWILALRLRRGR
jgi:hypothetical protein